MNIFENNFSHGAKQQYCKAAKQYSMSQKSSRLRPDGLVTLCSTTVFCKDAAMKKIGVVGMTELTRAPSLSCQLTITVLVLVVSHIVPCILAQEDQIVFNAESTDYVLEEQPVGTAAVVLEAYYITYSPFLLGADGIFTLDTSQPDSQFFTIESAPNEENSFTLGTLRTAAVLDRDAEGAQTVFTLTVTYSTPDESLSSQETITILLVDVNDNAPRFSQAVYWVAVLENSAPGSSVIQLTATDSDEVLTQQLVDETGEDFGDLEYLIDNGRVFYSLAAGNETENFQIDSEGGTIFVSPGATFDVDTQDRYNITVVAMDAPGLNSTALVQVDILDSNDNHPQILFPRGLNLTLSEDTPTGLVILDSINATDEDHGLNAEIQFLIISGDGTGSFSIDPSTGRITLTAPLDRERGTGEIVNLVVAAQDQGVPPLQDTINVIVSIEDVNDFPPLFAQDSYEASVREGVRSGFEVLQVVASDRDEGPGGLVSYSFIEGAEGSFYIDPRTGKIFTNATFDREERSWYQLVVEAVDNPVNVSFQLSSVVNVTIAIGDLNDNQPIFNQSLYEIHILDNHTRGADIIQISACDSDDGVNAEITYHFIDPLPSNSERFRIGETAGLVEVNQRPRFDIQSVYNFIIRALDGGTPPLHSDANLTIHIHDVDETPPTFEQDAYNVTLNETVAIGTVVLYVVASDPDPGPIGEVSYRVTTEFDDAGSFAVDAESGAVSVASRLDFDARNFSFFQVEAFDGGFPEPFTDVTNVTIFLQGENDEPPTIIFPEGYFPTVPEDEPPGYDIVYLSNFTTDPDMGLGGQFNFSLYEIYDPLSEGVNGSFSLDTTTGLLKGLRVFDREAQPQGIVVAIETSDFGMPPQSKVTNITVMIGDKNDQGPCFPSNLSITAYEFFPPGVQILEEYQAIDDDIGINAELEYNIVEGDPQNHFSVNPQTGGIFTAATLNKTDQKFYNLTIIARDGGTPQFHTFGQIEIEVIDANDRIPTFSLDEYTANVSENVPPATVFFQVNASDADIGTNAQIQYFLNDISNTSEAVNERFTINATTGEIATNDMFDREIDTSFILHIIAIDNGSVPVRLTGSAMVLVNIEDRNDHTPTLHNTTYSGDVVENSPNGTYIVSVSASDNDAESPNNDFLFSLNGSRSDVFQIDPTSGDVTVAAEVDWEEGGVISIVVIVTDLGDPPLSSTADVTIFIEDINDRAPKFTPGSLNLGIYENTDPPAPVEPTVVAVDLDSPGNSSHVTYQVVMDLASGRFELDSETGEVTFVQGSLNRERHPFYELLIRALDHGDPQLHTDASLIINVLDTNDFGPVFDRDLFTGSIPENSPLGTTILTLGASDMDVGTNAELSFSIIESVGSGEFGGLDDSSLGLFAVNVSSGDLTTSTESFDFEHCTSYSLVVMVTDHGNPPQSHTSHVTVMITDFNDNAPVFFESAYSAAMQENLSPYTTILQVGSSDLDSGSNKDIRYSLAEGGGSEYFDIDPHTGVLYTVRYIDREVTSSFELTVVANNSLSPHPIWSNVTASVTVLDLNDTHPSFDIVTNVYVQENASVGKVIFNLSATDGDEGLAGIVRYSDIHGNEDGVFQLDPITGAVVLLLGLDFENTSLYEFVVSATDMAMPNLINYTNVLVHIVDINDNAPYFISNEYTVTVDNLIPVNTVILDLVAEDADSGTNSELQYEITEGNELFALQSSAPSLYVTQSLEQHIGQSIILVVMVHNPDSTGPIPAGYANVTIHIQEVLSSQPRFTQTSFTASIAEDQASAILIELSSVTIDGDIYGIESGNTLGIFNVDNAGTGTLTSGASVDHDCQPTYQLTIRAENMVGDKAYCVLTITVTDVNDISPEFISSSFLVHIPETTPVGIPFFFIMATDNDGSSPANEIEINFFGSISEEIASTFAIDPLTGGVALQRSFDFENADYNFTFEIAASNERASPTLSSVTTMTIVVVNGNNHAPVFTSPILEPVVLYENQTVGLSIFNATAEDEDQGSAGEVTFGLKGNHRYLDFSIDTFTGEVRLNSNLDRERTTLYQLEVVAADRGNPGLTSTTLLVVGVQDVNDNSPVWEQLEYSVNLLENTSIGAAVAVVEATDVDQVDFTEEDGEVVYFQTNGLVQYSITEGDPRGQFFVEPLSGDVTIAAPLDRELTSRYTLTLTAADGGGRTSNATLYITVLDTNDVRPTFSQDEYSVAIPENSDNGTFVLTVSAADTDLAEGAFFFYDIDSGNIDDAFVINASTGNIWLDLPILDREEISTYNLTVVAIDFGDPPLTGSTHVLVHLLDLNEFPPVFDQDGYTGSIPESASLLTSVLTISSLDLDFGENTTATYSIASGNNQTRFGVGPSSGVIFVANPLDFEVMFEYELVVLATDSGPISTQLSSEVNVTVVVTDVNDNKPVFQNSSYSAVVREDASPLSPLLTLLASDDDSGVNAEILFSLDPLVEDSEYFIVDPQTGLLSLSTDASLDYETQAIYLLIAIAMDSGTPQLNSTVPVTIVIADVNDNTPLFISTSFNASVAENSAPGLAIAAVTATDSDSGDNAVITYSIVRQIENESDCMATCTDGGVCMSTSLFPPPSVSQSPFTIHNDTGTVRTALPLDRENRSSYLLAVKVSDSGNETRLSSLTCLLVTVLDENDENPTFPPEGYSTHISEYAGEGVAVAHVVALDADVSSNSEVTYRLLTESGHFTIHPATGEVLSLGGFDREEVEEYDVIVLATDGGEPPLNSSTVVTVSILDENDNAPLFSQSEYSVSLAENQPPFSSVLHLQATDADTGSNAELVYSIISAIPQNHFQINTSSGLLETTLQLDREEITSYLVAIISTDMGNPPMSSSTQVNITVLDTNDHAPVFTEEEYFVSVNENVVPNSPILYISASDADIGTNSLVQYMLKETTPHVDSFAISRESGALSVTSPLDAELSLSYTLAIIASNEGAISEQASVINVTVAVGDVNDHVPLFSRPEYVATVVESADVGSEVIQVVATDEDATLDNSELSFEISGGQNLSLFSIDPHTGGIFVSTPLDREREPSHTVQVTVYDNGMVPGRLETTVNVTFVLQDVNDNVPVFEQTSYLFGVHENNDSGILIGRVQANEIDLQSINYSIVEWSDGSGSGEILEISGSTRLGEFFEISPRSGEIFTTTSFDREERDLYTFYVVATDNGTNIQHSSEVLVSVAILDRNDVAPSFSLPNYTAAWPEDILAGSVLLAVSAADSDLGEGGRVEYFISPNDALLFSINASSGAVTLEGTFDREDQDSYQFEVIAQDYGMPSLTSSVVVVVTVLDVNDNQPILSAVEYSAVLHEDTPLNSVLINVAATDADISSNAEISFSLSSDSNSTFILDDRSGVISLTAHLDYEYAHNYTFSVVATDAGNPPLSSTADVLITVIDLNDNPPSFALDMYYTSIPENAILGTPVFQIPATDADSTSNGELRFSILAGNVAAAFEVEETSGLISLSDYIDREITGAYSLSLHAVDLGTPQLTAMTELVVEVVDVNDHIPYFDSDAYFVSIPELSGMGTLIVTIVANDDDIGVNANLTYSIIAGDPQEKFNMAPQTGELSIRGGLDFETVPSYSLTVQVSDQGLPEAQTNTVILSISILDNNEYQPSYPQSSYIIDLPDNTPPGTRVGAFPPSDSDLYMLPSLRYSLVENGNVTLFSIDQHSGHLYTLSLLPLGELHVSLIASDGLFTATVNITVVVFPLPSSRPVFQSSSSVFSVHEDTSLGETLGLLEVTNSSDVIFTLLGSFLDFPFEVTNEGEINLIGQLDYETTPTYLFSAQATSISNASLVSHTVVTMVIEDVNDNPPTFESSHYIVIIPELTPLNSLLVTLAAYDLDTTGVNSVFRFSIEGGNEAGNFNLDPLTGELTVGRVLDFEEHHELVLTVSVSNHLVSPVLHSEAEVRIELHDENDHSPQFTESYYQAEVAASAAEGTSVLSLSATDPDSGSNAELTYFLTHLDVPLSFTVDRTTGVVFTGRGFIGIVESYVVVAAVSDQGAPHPRSDTTTIFITVVPDNNFAPLFSEMEGYSVVVPETLPVGGSVVNILASDPDSVDSQITFSITSGDPEEIFIINPSTGLLTLAGSLDYQEQSLYWLQVTAEDSGTPSRRSPIAVNISIEDINNHAPLFATPTYTVSLLENATVGSSVALISASDVDASSITYILTVNSYQSGTPLFTLDSATGLLTTTAALDRELSGVHELLTSAVDSGYPIRLSNSVPVIIILIDLNDTPPQFDQSDYIFPVLRYQASDLYVAMVTATDRDLIGQQLEYDIVGDTSGGLFTINSTSGVISTRVRVPEDALTDYHLEVTAFDGALMTTVPVTLQLTSDGHFCEGSGLCTSVQPVNCSFLEFGSCDPRILGPLYNPFCTDDDYMLSPDEFLCVFHYCADSSLTPCLPSETCLPPSVACDGQCPEGTAVCPTTQLCHATSFRQSCDSTNITCLIGQILVESANHTRECLPLSSLPPSAQSCIEEQPYCIVIDECANVSSPNPCQTCPHGHVLCADTTECVASLSQCCGGSGFFCSILDRCLTDGDVCQLPNIPPTTFTTLIHVESILNFDSESGGCHMIQALLSNDSDNPAVDSQGEEVSVAVIEIPNIPKSQGEWQYATSASNLSGGNGDGCEYDNWVSVGSVAEDRALFLPSSAQIRFVRRAAELEGAMWMRVKLWDGNEDGYLSPTPDLVRYSQPRYGTTLPFSPTSALSEDSTLLSLLLFPTTPLPSLPSHSPLTLSPLTEDTPITNNPGNTLQELVLRVVVPDLPVLQENVIQGLPASYPFTMYESLQPAEVREYCDRVKEVNPTRLQRQRVIDRGLGPGMGIRLSGQKGGRWQVAWNGDIRQFVYVSSLLSSTNQILLLNTTARLRFLPSPDYCGEVSIPFQPWDGYWNESESNRTENGFLVAMDTALSQYNLNDVLAATQMVECVPDKPVFLVNQVQMEPIPYYISYSYERLFTVIISMEMSALRGDRDKLSDLLQLTLERQISVVRIAATSELSSQVSFSVEGENVVFSEVQSLLWEKAAVLETLGFPITNISQTAYYGPGESCSPSLSPLSLPGVMVASLTNEIADDRDGESLGVAVIKADSAGGEGVWQYLRGNWSDIYQKSYSYLLDFDTTPEKGPWINFPLGITESRALLLHPLDRIRYVPRPDVFWSSLPPSVSVKTWDTSVGMPLLSMANEAFLSAINTDPYTDTMQSLFYSIGVFSEDTAVVEAGRHGCDGVINSGLIFDSCCECGGTGESCAGCDGVEDSGKLYGYCDECGGDGGCGGCDLVPFSNSEPGSCKECVSVQSVRSDLVEMVRVEVETGMMDCESVCLGSGVTDECGMCAGGDSTHQYNSNMDCAGMCFGNAVVDDCGYCTGPGTMLTYNWNLDCTGICGGPFRSDTCGICQLPNGMGGVVEHRDCLGMCYGSAIWDECGDCYGELSSELVGSSLDACGVCGGQNSTCVGCDGSPASGVIVDSCEVCGGNDCGCFKIDFIEPQWGPKSGGTEILIHGAGFFLNDSNLISFDFDPQSENCGAPREKLGGESVSASCQFASGQNNAITADDITILNQSMIRCITKATTADLLFDLTVSIEKGLRSNAIIFRYYDDALVAISEMIPVDVEIGQMINVSFYSDNFADTGSSICFLYDTEQCGMDTGDAPVIIKANYISEIEIVCTFPAATLPCEVRVQMSLDGQSSGVVAPGNLVFTYRFSVPQVELVYFSDDLSDLIIQFDQQVERAGFESSRPVCSEVFSSDTVAMLGAPSDEACRWTNSLQEALAVHLPPSALITIHSHVSFRAGAITSRGQTYSYNISDLETFSIDSGLSSVPPVAIIDGPHSIPMCKDVKFTGIHSLNPGFSGMMYHWSVLTADSTTSHYLDILGYLDSLEGNEESISLASSWFVSGVEYYLQLVVMNSIGLESTPAIVCLVRDEEESKPQLYIVGQEVREVRKENVILEGAVFIPECNSESYQFDFHWQLYQITDERRGSLSAIELSSLPSSSPILYLPPSLLSSSSTYLIFLTISEPSLPYSETVNVTIHTTATGPLAHIHGGDRVVSVNRTLVLDARDSVYDPSLPMPAFSWSCNVIGSGGPCYNQSEATLTPIIIPATDHISIPGSDLEQGLDYNFTLTVSQTDFIKSYSSVAISVTSATPPIVEVTVGGGGGVTSREMVIRGLVYSVIPVTTILWESVSIEGHGYLDLSDPSLPLSPTTYPSSSISVGRTTSVNLILPPNSLSPHLTYTFQLTATNKEGVSFARVSVTPDPPPHSASVTVVPAGGGRALETVFTVSVHGALDSNGDSPFFYQFGVLNSASESSDGTVWLSGAQVEPSVQTLLPSGLLPGHNLTVIARVFDRSRGYSDFERSVTVERATTIDDTFIRGLLTSMETELIVTKNWQNLLYNLVSVAVEIDSTPSISPSIKRDTLSLFLEVFSAYLPATHTHYQLSTQLFSLLTDTSGTEHDAVETIAAALTAIGVWFQGQSAIGVPSIQPVASGNQDELLQLLPVERVSSPATHLSPNTAADLLAAWSNIGSSPDTPAAIATSFAEAVETLSFSLCQGMVYGEIPSFVTSSSVEVSVYKSPPFGLFNISGNLVELGTAIDELFYGQACPHEQQTCFETCFLGAQYSFDLFGNADFLQLTTAAEDKVTAEIEGSNPQVIELVSSILSVTVSIPSQNGFLTVEDLEQEFRILLRPRDSVSSNESVLLCLYRDIGGTSGFTAPQWQLDTTSPPLLVEIDSVVYYQCHFTHLTGFAVGLLPPPIPLPPSSYPTPTSSPILTSTPSPASSSTVVVKTPDVIETLTGISPAVVAIPIILVIITIAAVVCVIVFFLVWQKKKKRTMKVLPGEGPSGVNATDDQTETKLLRSGPLTPEESKVPMPIIELLKGGERKVIGSMNVLPSIRLRELRYHLLDNFASFKSKPFYFLTRQLVDIEPPSEQQQFVSLVYGQEADKPIFVRRVETRSDLTRLHFCVCGNAAQFECSSCSAQGYCSPECQTRDWADRHQRECGRLGEKKQRMSVLRRQSTTLSPIDEHKRLPSILSERQNMSAATPVDFRSLLNSQRSYQRPSFSSPQSLEPSVTTPSFTTPTKPTLPPLSTPNSTKTTIGMLASQSRPPTIREESEGDENGGQDSTLPSPTTPAIRPPVPRYSRARLPPLSSTPARPSLTSPPMAHLTATPSHSHTLHPSSFPHSTPITSHPHTSPTFFRRTNPKVTPPREPEVTLDTRKLSIQSLGPVDYGESLSLQQSRQSVRKEPCLESESDSSSESGSEGTPRHTRPTSTALTTRPPSLSVRSKKSAASKKTARSPPLSSSSGSGSEESTSSESHPATPLSLNRTDYVSV